MYPYFYICFAFHSFLNLQASFWGHFLSPWTIPFELILLMIALGHRGNWYFLKHDDKTLNQLLLAFLRKRKYFFQDSCFPLCPNIFIYLSWSKQPWRHLILVSWKLTLMNCDIGSSMPWLSPDQTAPYKRAHISYFYV